MFLAAHIRHGLVTAITAAVMATGLLVAGAGTVNADAAKSVAPDKNALTGSWVDTVTFPPEAGRPPLKSLVAFHGDGIMTYSDQGTVTLAPPTVFSSGRGVWRHEDKSTFVFSAMGLISDLNGNLVGYLKTRGIYTLSPSGNEYSGTTVAEVLDADGNPLFPAIEVTNAGRRIQLELP